MNRTIITIALLSAISASAQTITVTPGTQTYGYRSWNITVQPAPQPQTQYWTQPAPQPQIVLPKSDPAPRAEVPRVEAPTMGCAPNCDFSWILKQGQPEQQTERQRTCQDYLIQSGTHFVWMRCDKDGIPRIEK